MSKVAVVCFWVVEAPEVQQACSEKTRVTDLHTALSPPPIHTLLMLLLIMQICLFLADSESSLKKSNLIKKKGKSYEKMGKLWRKK